MEKEGFLKKYWWGFALLFAFVIYGEIKNDDKKKENPVTSNATHNGNIKIQCVKILKSNTVLSDSIIEATCICVMENCKNDSSPENLKLQAKNCVKEAVSKSVNK